MGLMKEQLIMLREIGVKCAKLDLHATGTGVEIGVIDVEFFPPLITQPQVQAHTVPMVSDMPTDDVMLFASTPTFDEVVKIEE